MIDSYVKKNQIRLHMFEYLLKNSEHTLKFQFIKSEFIENLFLDYIKDQREFSLEFNKIDMSFLAFRKNLPIRLEGISMFNTCLMHQTEAPEVVKEFIMYARRHFTMRSELNNISNGRITSQ